MGFLNYNSSSRNFILRFLLGVAAGYIFGHWLSQSQSNLPLTCKSEHKPKINELVYSETAHVQIAGQKIILKELTIKRNRSIYIGVMSTQKMLHERVAASLMTWMKSFEVTIDIFIGNNNNSSEKFYSDYHTSYFKSNIRVIRLPGCDDYAYPPTKKFYSMLNFMYTFNVDKFDWFIRLDDDAYADINKLRKLLSRVNASLPWYIGHPGFGKSKEDMVEWGIPFCLGGPGTVFSRYLLQKIGPHIGECLRTLFTRHDDIEISRCIHKLTGISCTVTYESKSIFFQNYWNLTSSHSNNIKSISKESLDAGITFHANKDPKYQHRFHKLLQRRKIAHLISRTINVEKAIKKYDEGVHFPMLWNSYEGNRYYQAEDQDMITKSPECFSKMFKEIAHETRLLLADRRGYFRRIDLLSFNTELLRLYHSVNIGASSNYLCLVEIKDKLKRKSKSETMKDKTVVYWKQSISQSYAFLFETSTKNLDAVLTKLSLNQESEFPRISGELHWHKMLYSNASCVSINFLIALKDRLSIFQRFLNNFENAFLVKGEKVNLIVSYFSSKIQTQAENMKINYTVQTSWYQTFCFHSENIIAKQIDENLKRLKATYSKFTLEVIFVRNSPKFSRGAGLQLASRHVKNSDEILFFCDVDLVFTSDILTRIRQNTMQGQQVYYPTFFSQYDPQVTQAQISVAKNYFELETQDGFWREFSYGMMSIYKSDFSMTSGFDLSINGWGLEDARMLDAILKTGLHVVKSREPGLFHIFHDKECSPSLSWKQLRNCRRSKAIHFGSLPSLYRMWKEKSKS